MDASMVIGSLNRSDEEMVTMNGALGIAVQYLITRLSELAMIDLSADGAYRGRYKGSEIPVR